VSATGDEPLPPGTRLDEFEIVRVLGIGGFGIVYLALDHVLERQVAIKEYMPSSLAGRGRGSTVLVRTPALTETFDAGLRSFVKEARLLASFDHPSLVKVHRFWEANGTAYMVMQYYPGHTLNAARAGMREQPGEAWLRRLAEPLLSALAVLHAQKVYHRDISPDNILLLPDGRPVLLDFGAARQVITDRTQALTAVLKPNFAPVEQYGDVAGMRQGPWTDLYALGAVMHFALTGRPPIPAVMRAVRDSMPLLAARRDQAFAGVSDSFLAAIDWTLEVAPENRPRQVDAVLAALNGEITPPAPAPRQPAGDADEALAPAGDWRKTEPAQRPGPGVAGAGGGGSSNRLRARLAALLPSAVTRAAAAIAAGLGVVLIGFGAWSLAGMGKGKALQNSTPAPVAAKRAESKARGPARQEEEGALARSSAAKSSSAPASRPVAETGGASSRASAGSADEGPQELCSGRNFFARAVCVHRLCQQPRFAAHAQCVQLREDAARRDEEGNR
jgi:hypothetical protein